MSLFTPVTRSRNEGSIWPGVAPLHRPRRSPMKGVFPGALQAIDLSPLGTFRASIAGNGHIS